MLDLRSRTVLPAPAGSSSASTGALPVVVRVVLHPDSAQGRRPLDLRRGYFIPRVENPVLLRGALKRVFEHSDG